MSSSSSASSPSRPSLSVIQDTPAPRPDGLRSRPHSPRPYGKPGHAQGYSTSVPLRRDNSPLGRSSFVGTVHSHASFQVPPTVPSRLHLFVGQAFSITISTFFLTFVVLWATASRLSQQIPRWFKGEKDRVWPWDRPEYWGKEKIVNDVGYYARQVGLDIVDEEVETEDGYFLRMHRVVNPRHRPDENGKLGYPVLILHGLFQSSGCFVTSEERSLAFWLSEQGYQVFLGNTRAVFKMGHRRWSRNDPRFWDWTIEELARYDLPALVDWVILRTGYPQVAYIGHSQGNGLAFLSLSQGFVPSLGSKLSCFIALAPAVFAGPLTHGFPFTLLNKMDWEQWKRIFGVLDFIPIMTWAYDYCPPTIFSSMGYTMFAFLFRWTDANWLKRRKNKMFRFTPTPVSSASIFWWCGKGGFADRKCSMDVSMPHWFDPETFPPIAIYYGGQDFLILTEPLLERFEKQEKGVKVIRTKRIEQSEHCDFHWAADAVEWCFYDFVEDIESTRWRPQVEATEESQPQPEEQVQKLVDVDDVVA